MKKLIVCMLALMLSVVPLAGCGSGGSSSTASTAAPAANSSDAPASSEAAAPAADGGPITFLAINWWESGAQPVIDKYIADTGVQVKTEYYSFNDMLEIIEVKIASGSSDYDVFGVDVPMVAAYATRGYLAPMDEYFTDAEKAEWLPSALAAGSWQDTLYAPPMNNSSQLLWYNIDLLAEGGVTIRESSSDNRLTYEEVAEYAKTALDAIDPDRNKGYCGISFQQVSRTYQMCGLPNSMGEKNIGSDGFTVDGVINTDGWVNAMTWYQNLYNNNLALRGYTADEAGPNFNAGKTLFMIGGTYTLNTIADVNYGFAHVPAFKGYEDKVGTPTGSWHFGINKASAQYDKAADFIKYLTVGEGNDLWTKANNDVPTTLRGIESISNDPNADPVFKIAAYEALNTAVPRAVTPGYSEYSSILDATFEDIRNGSEVKGALDSAVQQINSAFGKYKS